MSSRPSAAKKAHGAGGAPPARRAARAVPAARSAVERVETPERGFAGVQRDGHARPHRQTDRAVDAGRGRRGAIPVRGIERELVAVEHGRGGGARWRAGASQLPVAPARGYRVPPDRAVKEVTGGGVPVDDRAFVREGLRDPAESAGPVLDGGDGRRGRQRPPGGLREEEPGAEAVGGVKRPGPGLGVEDSGSGQAGRGRGRVVFRERVGDPESESGFGRAGGGHVSARRAGCATTSRSSRATVAVWPVVNSGYIGNEST